MPTMIIGQILGGRYQIIRTIGQGGFARTYLAEDTHLPDRPLRVVKQLQPQSKDPHAIHTARRLFDSEAKVLYGLGRCEGVPELFAHFEENQEFYLVQAYIDGQELSQEIVPGKPLSEPEVVNVLYDILSALSHVHQQGVIHRDIKPSNLIRQESDGKIFLIDFGAVKQITSQMHNPQGTTMPTVAIGTQGYMPLEQLKGYPQLSSDIYAVGIVGIQALTGILPAHLPKDPQTGEIIWKNWGTVNPSLVAILSKMVRERHPDRYQSADEALAALKTLTPGFNSWGPKAANPQILPTRVSTAPSKNLVIKSIGLTTLSIAGILLIIHLLIPFLKQPSPETQPVQSQPEGLL